MSGCTCARIDGFRIRSKSCPAHDECLDSSGPVPKLGGVTHTCVKPRGHEMPHEAPDGTWWEPQTETAPEPREDVGILAPRCPRCGWQAVERPDDATGHAATLADVVAHKAQCEPRGDVTVAEVLARVLLLHQDTYEDAPLIRCMCGEQLLTLTEHVHHVATMQHFETAPLIAERERRAAVEALREASDERAAKKIAADAADRFRDVLSECLGHADENPGDDVLVTEVRAHFGKTGPEPTRWRDFLTGALSQIDQIRADRRAER